MNAKEYGEMRKLANKAIDGTITSEEAVRYLLLMEKSRTAEVLKVCQDVLRRDAAEKKKVYTTDDGTVTVLEPYVQAVNEEELKAFSPEIYDEIIAKKVQKIKIAVSDLSKDDQAKYVHFVKGTAKVRIDLA